MIRQFAVILLTAATFAFSAGARTLPDSLQRSSFSAGASFDVNIPSGSHGLWTTGSGVTAGVDYAYRFTPKWFIATGLKGYYRTFGTEFMIEHNSVFEGTVRNIGLRVPLMAGYSVPLTPQIGMSIATGPVLEVNLYARETAMPDFTAGGSQIVAGTTVDMFKRGFKRVNAIWGIALGFTFAEHYYVGLAGGVAFTPLANYGNHDNKLRIKGNSIAVKLSYTF